MEKKIELSTRDHFMVGLYSILILLSFKFAVNVTAWGFILVWLNIFFFDVYAHQRKYAN